MECWFGKMVGIGDVKNVCCSQFSRQPGEAPKKIEFQVVCLSPFVLGVPAYLLHLILGKRPRSDSSIFINSALFDSQSLLVWRVAPVLGHRVENIGMMNGKEQDSGLKRTQGRIIF